MPNWVFNNISGYTEEMHNKYKNEEEELDIDFNKVIPMPEELNIPDMHPTHENAIAAFEYDQYKNNTEKPYYYHAPVSIRDSMENYYNRNIADFGKMAVSNPDKSLNDIITNPYDKRKLEELRTIYGDLNESNDKVGIERLDRYTDYIENNYHEIHDRDKNSMLSDSIQNLMETHPTLVDLGKHYNDCKEKYGFDNWYDWRVANWGTKWNASETNYDGETIHFDTAWSVPHPIIAKIAEEFPETKLYGRSDEESGWFEEYYTKDGKLGVVSGESEYDEENDTYEDIYDDITEPSNYESYDEISQRSIKEWASFVNRKKLIF